ncbi:MAG: folate-binding protein YgfZ [Pseudolabrys sp.]|nr:folate-binding protein YgfZ [Pseudolabrys sp.]
MQAALLPDRGVVKVTGDDSRRFLNNLVTADIEHLTPGAARYAALLTPQGKIIVDFLVTEASTDDGGGFFFDVPRALAPDFVEKLNFYKLRAKIAVEDLSAKLGVMAVWGGGNAPSEYGLDYPDPRHAALGRRVVLPQETAKEAAADLGADLTDSAAYETYRIGLGIPRGGQDFAYGDTFPHEADMDQLAGIDFEKGCYVGQEVVSRVEHRASARKRVVPVSYAEFAPVSGLQVLAGDKEIGQLFSTANKRGLAMLRLDRAADAINAGHSFTAGGVEIKLVKPDWASFEFPGDPK